MPGAAPQTQRLYLEEPQRKTALATVTGHASGGFLLDRTLYHAPDKRYHHLQPEDRGHLLAEGHKLKIPRVFLDQHHRIVHRTTGPLPDVGAKAQLHLDADRRDQQARAHTAMHLLIAAVAETRGTWLEPPRIVGGGEIRLHTKHRDPPGPAVQRILARANQLIANRLDVTPRWMPRDDAARHATPQALPLHDIAPEEPTLRLIQIGETSNLPCDAPLVANTRDLTPLRATYARPTNESLRWGAKLT